MNVTPDAREKFAIVLNNYDMFGLKQTLKDVCIYLLSRKSDEFDARHGVLTSGTVQPSEAGIVDPTALDGAIVYEPTDERVMRHILSYVRNHLVPSEFTFVDLGCGKGRAILMASRVPFAEVVGVELSPLHCDIARKNVERYMTHAAERNLPVAAARVVHDDATRFEFPETNLFIYMFNPFRASVVRSILDRLAEFQKRTARSVLVALSAPIEADYLLRAHPAFTKQCEFQVILLSRSWSLWKCQVAR